MSETKGWGGKRPGSGPKRTVIADKSEPASEVIHVRVAPSQMARLDRVRGGLKRSEFGREAILAAIQQQEYRMGIEDAEESADG